ncbi:unnamed protein product [Dicrocoelium dendriticum]|nr:unnamed protein product [Dicrocoelium dendriticum]
MCEVGLLVDKSRPDILAFTETWLSEEITDGEVYLPGYALFRADRSTGRQGGGVALYVSYHIDVLRTSVFQSLDKSVEALAVLICASSVQVTVVLVYRSPMSTSNGIIDFIRTHSANKCLVLGDFNLPDVCWDDLSCSSTLESFGTELLDLTLQVPLHQFVDLPTRYMSNQQPSILDLVFAKSLDFVNDIKYDSPLGASDHVCLSFQCALIRSCQATTSWYPNIWAADFQAMRDRARSSPCVISETDTVHIAWEKLKAHLVDISAPHVPLVKRRESRAQPPWIDSAGKGLLKKRSRCWRAYRTAPSNSTFDKYRLVRNECKLHLRLARLQYEKGLANTASKNPKRFFAYVKRRCGANSPIPPLLRGDGTHAYSDYDKACVLGKQYSSVFVRETNTPCKELVPRVPEDCCLDEIPVTESQVLRLLKEVNPTKASGPDSVHPKLLHELAGELSGPLTCVFQKSLNSCILPTEWKEAVVCPIFKCGDKDLPANYRPVSLTSVVVKLLEKLVRDTVENHLSRFNLLSVEQHGFRKGFSCQTNLLVARECWAEAVDSGHAVDVVFIDFAKAFDTVPHSRLSLKLRSYGIAGRALQWVSAFLDGREQCIRVGSSLSFRQAVLSGVPQGSVLGPLLFSVYVNDLPEELEVQSLLFADDLKLWNIVDIPGGPMALQRALDKLWEWSVLWLLPINRAKCSVLRIGASDSSTSYVLDGTVLPHVTHQVDLGVVHCSTLHSGDNWKKAASKGFRMLWFIRRSFGTLTADVFVKLFSAFVRPHLEYCVQACPPCLVRDKMALERVLRVGTRLVKGLRGQTYPERLLSLGMQSMHYRRIRGDLILTYRILTGKVGPDLSMLFSPARLSGLRGHCMKLDKPRSDRVRAETRLSRRVIERWNLLPENVVKEATVKGFERQLDALGWQHETFPFS